MATDVEYRDLTEEELKSYNTSIDNLSKRNDSKDYYQKLENYTKKVLDALKNDSKKTELFIRLVNKYMDNLKNCHNYANQKEAYEEFVANLISVDILKDNSDKLIRLDQNKWLAIFKQRLKEDKKSDTIDIEEPPFPATIHRSDIDTEAWSIYFDDNNKFHNR